MEGIVILINGQKTDTSGISFSLNRFNPLIDFDNSMKGDYVQSLTFNNSPINSEIFKHPMRLSLVGNFKEFNLQCYHFGNLLFAGICTVLSADSESINTNVKIGTGIFWYELADKKMDEFDLGTIEILDHQSQEVTRSFVKHCNEETIDSPIVFPMIAAEEFYGSVSDGKSESNKDYGLKYYQTNNIIGRFINNWDDNVQIPQRNSLLAKQGGNNCNVNVNTLVPHFRLPYILNTFLRSKFYTPSGRFFVEDEFNRILIGNNHTIDKQDIYTKMSKTGLSSEIELDTPETSIELNFDTVIEGNAEHCFSESTGIYTTADIGTYVVKGKLYLDANPDLDGSEYHVWIYCPQLSLAMGGPLVECKVRVGYSNGISGDKILTFVSKGIWSDTAGYDLKPVMSYKPAKSSDMGGPPHEFVYPNSWVKYERTDVLNSYNNIITVSDHMPNIKAKDFFKNIFKIFAVAPFFDEEKKQCKLVFFNDIISDPTFVEFSDNIIEGPALLENECTGLNFDFDYDIKPEEFYKDISEYTYVGEFLNTFSLPYHLDNNSIAFVISHQAYYLYTIDQDTDIIDWEFFCFKSLPKVIGDGNYDMKVDFFSPITDMIGATLYPRISANGISALFTLESDKVFYLLNYSGMQNNANGNKYPYASSTAFVFSGNQVLPTEISFNSAIGYFEKYLKNWVNMIINSKPIKIKKLMNSSQIKNLDFSKKHRVFGIDYIIKSMVTDVTQSEILECEFEMDSF